VRRPERDSLEGPGIDGGITLISIFRKSDGNLYWTDLAQKKDGYWALVNPAMNLRYPQND